MKYLKTYYLIDSLSETIVGSFTAPNERFAVKRVKATIDKSDDLKDIVDTLVLRCSVGDFEVCETYEEAAADGCTYNVGISDVISSFKESDNG